MNKWSEELNQDVFDRILNLCSFRDCVRVGIVCKSWNEASKLNRIRRPQPPRLMMPSNECVYSLTNDTYCKMPQIPGKRFCGKKPKISDKRFCGSFINSGGWLMIIYRNMEVQLFHPGRGIHWNLPPFSISNVSDVSPDWDSPITKAAMSDDAAVVAVIYLPYSIAFCRREDMIWISIDVTDQSCRDIIYSKGRFLTVGWNGAIGVLNINITNPYVETLTEGVKDIFTTTPPLFMRSEKILYAKGCFYPVRSDGVTGGVINLYGEPQMRGVKFSSRNAARLLERGTRYCQTYLVPDLVSESLFIVNRFAEVGWEGRTVYICATYDFQVFELQEGGGKPVEVDSLGDRAMFLGLNSSMLVMASRFSGLEGNRIYFTDDWARLEKLPSANADMGIFNMEDRTIRPLFPNRAHPSSLPPIWITPPPLV